MKKNFFIFFAFLTAFFGCQNPVNLTTDSVIGEGAGTAARGYYGGTDRNIVLLQGFHWNSNNVSSGWYNIINSNAQRIKDSGFNMVWYPPVSKTADSVGYLPNELNNFTTRYGSESQLRTSISTLKSKGIVAIADVVVNHRAGTTNWADFTNPSWSTYTICANDEWNGAKSVNWDEGDGIGAARDLDHKNPETQNGIKTWMKDKLMNLGFQGWRYDMVKGYKGWSVGMYNDHTAPVFSVGEYWDNSPQNVVGWIDSTNSNPAKRSAAFDFPFRNALYEAAVNRHYNYLKYGDKLPGVVGLWSEKAVTFVENHDLEEARNGAYGAAFPNDGRMLQAYAVILTHPGTPSVFWQDIYDTGSYNEWRIREMITVRQKYGIQSTSTVYIAMASDGYGYAAYIKGTNGEIAVKVGPGAWSPSGTKWAGSKLLYSGPDYAIWGEWGKWW